MAEILDTVSGAQLEPSQGPFQSLPSCLLGPSKRTIQKVNQYMESHLKPGRKLKRGSVAPEFGSAVAHGPRKTVWMIFERMVIPVNAIDTVQLLASCMFSPYALLSSDIDTVFRGGICLMHHSCDSSLLLLHSSAHSTHQF